ncbi:MAG TPA: histidine--tRNA ligase [Longimicrobiales bacterium]
MSIKDSLPGFRDFYPRELAYRSHIFAAWREAARRFGFEEYDGPPLEPLELYTGKSGEEIVRQLYNFEDKGGREVSLRPEMTPTLARMAGARAGELRKPVRWFSIPQLFRYERTQRGRLREHFQWNVDIVGEESVAADAEVLAVALTSFQVLGLTAQDVVARVSDRRLLERLLLHVGVPADQLMAAYAAIDKLGREEDRVIAERLAREAGLGPATVEQIFQIFAHASFESLQAAYAEVEGVAEELARVSEYLSILSDLGFAAWVSFDARIVRGLAYYTGIVFEVFDRKGELRAVCGGGRYDRLLEQVAGVSLPALGFGMGDVVLKELLADRQLLPDAAPAADYYLVAVGEPERAVVRQMAARLRRAGHSVLYALKGAGVKAQFKEANARGARSVVVVGPEEVAAGVVKVRSMGSGEEVQARIEELGE